MNITISATPEELANFLKRVVATRQYKLSAHCGALFDENGRMLSSAEVDALKKKGDSR